VLKVSGTSDQMMMFVASAIFLLLIMVPYGFADCPPCPCAQQTTSGGICAQAQYDFQQACIAIHNGVPDGGRCFYSPKDTAVNWYDSWMICMRRGGTLAPVLTGSEMKKISTTLLAKTGDILMWTSGQRIVPATTGCAHPPNNTYYYDADQMYYEKMVFNNNFMRNRECYDTVRDGQCIHMFVSLTKFGDYDCSKPYGASRALCQITSPVQEFVMVNDVCLTENPIESYTVANVHECFTVCRERSWCRSVNVVDGSKCDLFPWWINDTPNQVVKSPGCVHYTYVP